MLKALKKEAIEKLATFCKGQDYPAFVRQLIVQGLIKIEEQEVEVQCRPEDRSIVSKVVSVFNSSAHYSLCNYHSAPDIMQVA